MNDEYTEAGGMSIDLMKNLKNTLSSKSSNVCYVIIFLFFIFFISLKITNYI